MTPLRGWAPLGERLRTSAPHGRWNTMTFIAALRHDRIDAPWLVDGPINAECFLTDVESVLVPTLKSGDLVRGCSPGKAAGRCGSTMAHAPSFRPVSYGSLTLVLRLTIVSIQLDPSHFLDTLSG